METSTLSKEKYEMYSFQEKGGIRKSNGAKCSAQGDKKKRFKGKTDSNSSEGTGNLRARSHPPKLSACEKELRKV